MHLCFVPALAVIIVVSSGSSELWISLDTGACVDTGKTVAYKNQNHRNIGIHGSMYELIKFLWSEVK